MSLIFSHTVVRQLVFLPWRENHMCEGRDAGESERERHQTSPDPGTASECPAAHILTFLHPLTHSFRDFPLTSPLCGGVISLMMYNALKVFQSA